MGKKGNLNSYTFTVIQDITISAQNNDLKARRETYDSRKSKLFTFLLLDGACAPKKSKL